MCLGMAISLNDALVGQAGLREGPVWGFAQERLIWVDVVGRLVHIYDPATGEDTSVEVPDMPGVAIPRRAGGLVLAIGHGFGFLDDEGRFEQIATLPQREVTARMNDGNC